MLMMEIKEFSYIISCTSNLIPLLTPRDHSTSNARSMKINQTLILFHYVFLSHCFFKFCINNFGIMQNYVICSFDGSNCEVYKSFIYAISYFRLLIFSHGIRIDLIELLRDENFLHTTPPTGSFYFIVTYEGKSSKFVFDTREGWMYGGMNEKTIFEFKVGKNRKPYIDNTDAKILTFEKTLIVSHRISNLENQNGARLIKGSMEQSLQIQCY